MSLNTAAIGKMQIFILIVRCQCKLINTAKTIITATVTNITTVNVALARVISSPSARAQVNLSSLRRPDLLTVQDLRSLAQRRHQIRSAGLLFIDSSAGKQVLGNPRRDPFLLKDRQGADH